MFPLGVNLSTLNSEHISARLAGLERGSGQSPFWSAEEPNDLEIRQTRELYELEKKVPQMQELQELGKEDYQGFFGSTMDGFILYLIKKTVGLLIFFLLFALIDLFFGEILIDMIFEDACFGFPGEDCS